MAPFHIIILGAGISGLTASHCLQAAGISHVVLEKHTDPTPPEGSSISIYPHMMRVLSQLGLYSAITKISTPHKLSHTRGSDGRLIGSNDLFGKIQRNHGDDIYPMERRAFLRVLWDGLPNKGLVRLGCRVTSITHTEDNGIEVLLANGSIERGDLVIGCDGAHSVARKTMLHLPAAKQSLSPSSSSRPATSDTNKKTYFKPAWKCLTGIAPPFTSELTESDMTVVHDRGYSFLLLAQPHCTFFFVFIQLSDDEKKEQEQEEQGHHRYTEEDAEKLGNSLVDHAITENLNFGQLWEGRSRVVLVPLAEGVLDTWHGSGGRIVLAGDAVHQVTPNIAWGGNTAMEDVVVLCNLLYGMLSPGMEKKQWGDGSGDGGDITTGDERSHCSRAAEISSAELATVLQTYQDYRLDRVKWITTVSGAITRAQAQTSFLWRVVAWLMAYLPVGPAADQLGYIVRDGAKLDYLLVRDDFATDGLMAWKYK